MTFFQTGREKRRPHPNLSPRHAVSTITRDGRGPFEHSGHVKINAKRYPVHGALENQSKSGSAGGAISWLPTGPTREQVNDACRTDNEHCLYFCLIAMRAHPFALPSTALPCVGDFLAMIGVKSSIMTFLSSFFILHYSSSLISFLNALRNFKDTNR
ncbi:uncharacterized protein LOC143154324 [Ptiloglossa arizonensis]|uniref:uncharacterized protein LOC143154324 n=1 Tax=Ptiloglossa arizonensis TaxID=3350558 RepID=UPI003F9F5249